VETAAPVAQGGEDAQVKKGFALMAKRERGLALKAHDLSQKAEAFKAEKAEFEEWKSARANSKRDPVSFLKKEYGDDWYDKMTELRLSGGKVTPELLGEAMDAKIAALEKKHEEAGRKQLEEQKAQVLRESEQSFHAWKDEVHDFVRQQADAYELINHFEVHDRVTAKIQSEFAKTQKLITPKDAADAIEKQLEEAAGKSKKLGKAPAAPVSADKRNDPLQRRTLSNDMTGSTPAAKPPPVDDAERRRRALAAMDAVQAHRAS
jgi:hypothetical protein